MAALVGYVLVIGGCCLVSHRPPNLVECLVAGVLFIVGLLRSDS